MSYGLIRQTKLLHRNGFVKSAGLKKGGLKDGPWSFYDEEGELLRTVEYEDGTELKSSQ